MSFKKKIFWIQNLFLTLDYVYKHLERFFLVVVVSLSLLLQLQIENMRSQQQQQQQKPTQHIYFQVTTVSNKIDFKAEIEVEK